MLDNICFGKWEIEHNIFRIEEFKPLKEQIWELNEDILQAVYSDNEGNHYTLDLGWYPEFDINGHFTICLIKNYDWENPLMKVNCDTASLRGNLKKFIDYINCL
jgi:hypothetical protein